MNPKIEKLAKDIEKTKAKIAEQQARLQDLEKQKTELENTDFVAGPQLPPDAPGTGRILKNAADGVRTGVFAAGTGGSA